MATSVQAGTGRNEDGDFTELRDRAVDELVKNGTITSSAVEAAMRKVPRHLFAPEARPEEAYDPFHAVVTKRDEDGNALSSVSDMHVQAWMLEQARLGPGMNVLEVGSGGYNAALAGRRESAAAGVSWAGSGVVVAASIAGSPSGSFPG